MSYIKNKNTVDRLRSLPVPAPASCCIARRATLLRILIRTRCCLLGAHSDHQQHHAPPAMPARLQQLLQVATVRPRSSSEEICGCLPVLPQRPWPRRAAAAAGAGTGDAALPPRASTLKQHVFELLRVAVLNSAANIDQIWPGEMIWKFETYL